MEQKLKVLHVVNGLGFGGAETWLLEIVKTNTEHIQFDFLLTGGIPRELDEEFLRYGCRLHYLRFSLNKTFSFARELSRLVRREGYTVIHDHEDFVAGWHFLFLLFRLPEVRIAHAHNSMIYVRNYAINTSRKLFYRGGRLLNGLLATKITGTSGQLMEELGYNKRLYRRKRIEPLYCGTSPALFRFDPAVRRVMREKLGFSPLDKAVIFIGRIGLNRKGEINHKNPEFAVALAKRLAMKDAAYRFLFTGEKGDLGQAWEAEMKREGLAKQILFLGKRKDINELMLAADLLLFTSTLEPFGLVLVEAQFCALPIVASDIITPEIIQFPELFRLQDIRKGDVEEWAKAVEEALDSDLDRQVFAERKQDEMDRSKFSIAASYRRLLQNYRQ